MQNRLVLWRSLLTALLFCFAGVGCAGQESVEDALFEHWLRSKLLARGTWQFSSSGDDPRNAGLHACVWQSSLSEKDCRTPKEGALLPVMLRFENGYLATHGLRHSTKPGAVAARLDDTFADIPELFGFTRELRPCVGSACRFEVFVGVRPVCPGAVEVCGRAQTLQVSYVIRSRLSRRGIFRSREILLTDQRKNGGKGPVIVAVDALLDAAPVHCPVRGSMALVVEPKGQPTCFLKSDIVRTFCKQAKAGFERLRRLKVCTNPQECSQICADVNRAPKASCPSEGLYRDFWTPDLFRCRNTQNVVYFESSLANRKENSRGSLMHGLFSSFLSLNSDSPLCFRQTKLCFGGARDERVDTLVGYVSLYKDVSR